MQTSATQFDWMKSVLLLTALSFFVQISWWLTYYGSQGKTLNLINTFLISNLGQFGQIIFRFFLSQIFINFLFVASVLFVANAIVKLFKLSSKAANNISVVLWLLAMVTVLAGNYYYFPNSIFANPLAPLAISQQTLQTLLLGTTAILVMALLLACVNVIYNLCHKKDILLNTGVIFFLALTACTYITYYRAELPVFHQQNTAPNVIIIGLDALRPDYTQFYGNPNTHTPNIDKFLKTSTILPDAHTPLARTFPAWMSILTGTYPKHNGARNNLSDISGSTIDTLAKHLQANGYKTVYATDDSSFSVITKDLGFKQVIQPPVGIGSFFMYFLNDFPLTNLLTTTPFGKWLFPFNYANHADSVTYDPENFMHLLKVQLSQRSNKPLFLAVHFNVSGWPFKWSQQKITDSSTTVDLYQNAVAAADAQLGEFLTALSNNHLLKHTLVILLSDHGIGLGTPGDRVTTRSLYEGNKNNITLGNKSYSIVVKDNRHHIIDNGLDTDSGYGGDILDQKSYRSLLAFKGYGFHIGATPNLYGLVSLLDIAPTILDFLNLKPLVADGMSLKPYFVDSHNKITPERELFMETTLTISFHDLTHIPIEKVMQQNSKLFHINSSDGTITMTKEAQLQVGRGAQKSVLQGDWLLADIPPMRKYKLIEFKKVETYLTPPQLILVNLKTGQWTTEMDTTFAKLAPLSKLEEKLKNFYGTELSYDFNKLH